MSPPSTESFTEMAEIKGQMGFLMHRLEQQQIAMQTASRQPIIIQNTASTSRISKALRMNPVRSQSLI